MKLFACTNCQQIVYFENVQCTRCGHALAYLPDEGRLVACDPGAGSSTELVAVGSDAARYRRCGNWIDHDACNWAVSTADEHRFCRSCRLNELIPPLSDPTAKQEWLKMERGKRRTIQTLLALGLPVVPRSEDPRGLAFAFKKDLPGQDKVMIGHDKGLITINVAEADAPFREKTRIELGEPYRTVLGHFRHEVGHYYWERLVAGSSRLAPFRALFGDERASYEEAVAAHYRDGAPADWSSRFVSAYASMHPWEDWAESWAHYLHMVDTLDTARAFGLSVRAVAARPADQIEATARRIDFEDFDALFAAWTPVTIALNSLNRSMGLGDPYPFVPPGPAVEKIRFVHDVVHGTS